MVFTDLQPRHEAVIYEWVNQVVGTSVNAIMWSYQDFEVPDKPYIVLDQMTASDLEHKPDVQRIGPETYRKVYYEEFTLSVLVVANSGNRIAKELVRSLFDDEIIELFKSKELVCRYSHGLIHVPRLQNTHTSKSSAQKYELTTVADFVFAYSEDKQYNKSEVSTVDIDNNL